MKPQLRDMLGCPRCHQSLADSNEGLLCLTCHKTFSVVNNIPILLPDVPETNWRDAESLYRPPHSRWLGKLKAWAQPPSLLVGKTLHDRLKQNVISDAPPGTMILNLGSGIENLYNQDHFVNFDIYPHHNVDVVGDGHFLPFLPETFDVVWLCAVLEHIRKPWLLCNQVARVLKPGGKVLVSAPFIQKGHGAPYDFFRYTPEGLRSLFDDFEEIECGPSYTRPSGTLVHVIGAWANAVFPGKLGRMVELCLLWGLGWLKMIDKVAPPSSLGWTMAGGSCYLGRKPMQLQDIKSP